MKKNYRKASDDILRVLARNTRYFRFKRGWTQAELAKACGFEANYISGIERAKINITLANLENLTNGLGISEYDMLDKHSIARDLRANSTETLSKSDLKHIDRIMANAHVR
jgi:transcriptional regulator with XRE-family HTH domain